MPKGKAESFPEVIAPDGFEETRRALERSGLVAPFVASDGERRYAVHRWTATSLAGLASAAERRKAHRRAALYWDWRVEAVSHNLEEYLEARYHWHRAGEIERAVALTNAITEQLEVWGAYRRAEPLSYDEALGWYRKSLAIEEELGNRAGMATSYHQLGNFSTLRGSYDEALEWYRQSLAIEEELGNRAGMAASYAQLADLFTELENPVGGASLRASLSCPRD